METVLLQPWTTISGGASTPVFTQDDSGWVDLAGYSDIAGLWIEKTTISKQEKIKKVFKKINEIRS